MSSSSEEMRKRLERVKTNFNEELGKNIDSKVCVFQVPKSLSSPKPEAYTPQLVGLGPYHHLQPQLMEMERVKLDVVKKILKEFRPMSFAELENLLGQLNPYVSACYHKFLDVEGDMLSWIMTVDALFLFDLLCRHRIGKEALKSPSFLPGLADQAGKKLAEDAILRDVMMLENQIPIFFVMKMLTAGCYPLEVPERKDIVEGLLPLMLEGFCIALSPLKETIKYPDPEKPDPKKALKRAHLLDLLYSMVVKRDDEFKIDIPPDIINIEYKSRLDVLDVEASCALDADKELAVIFSLGEVAQTLVTGGQVLPGLTDLYSRLKSFIDSSRSEAPAEEKSLIPTASSLAKAGIKFSTTHFIEDIKFEEKTRTFQLPAIKLGINSEVVIRNLVAYEAMSISHPLVFARFMELMDGLIDTPDDVKLLKKQGIVTGHLEDDEVTKLFNGLSNSIEVNGDCELDKTIKRVRESYNAAPNIKARKLIERYVSGAWKALAVVAIVLYFLFMALQTIARLTIVPASSIRQTNFDLASTQ
ncbi:WD_REPEATS_REGION domain-containing protein [Psidium guajava]|nr:WD_REPEATS_REGION domain-containing protein [Psidium guajava]